MRKSFFFLTLLMFVTFAPSVALAGKVPAALKEAKICKSVKKLTSGLLKNTYPGHIYAPDPRHYGFAYVCGFKDCPKRWPVKVYYSDGKRAFKLGYYGTWPENRKPRAYTGTNGAKKVYVNTIVKRSKARGIDGKKRNGKVYIHIGNKKCRAAIPGKRNGSPWK